MSSSLPGWIRRPPASDDDDRWRSMSPDQRLEILVELLAVAEAQLDDHRDADRVRATQAPRSKEAIETWRRLVRGGRGA